MGYYARATEIDLTIPAEKVMDAFSAAIAMNTDPALQGKKTGNSYTGQRWFSWVSDNYHETARDLIDVVDTEFRFEDSYYDDKGNFHLGYFNSKMGHEKVLFEALAPFVEDGSFVEWRGEDEAHWRWNFQNGTLAEQVGKIVWE